MSYFVHADAIARANAVAHAPATAHANGPVLEKVRDFSHNQ